MLKDDQDGALSVAGYRSSSWYFVVYLSFYSVLSLFLFLICTLCCGSILYPHNKMLFHRIGYLLVTFFVLFCKGFFYPGDWKLRRCDSLLMLIA